MEVENDPEELLNALWYSGSPVFAALPKAHTEPEAIKTGEEEGGHPN